MSASTTPAPNGTTAQTISATVKVMIGASRNSRCGDSGSGQDVREKVGPETRGRNEGASAVDL